jgi:hypothetical protein
MDETYRATQLQHIREALAENERSHTPEEVAAAVGRAETDSNRIIGRREPVQQTLTLAA